MSQISSNSKNESLIGSEELGATDQTVSFEPPQRKSDAGFSQDKSWPALGLRQIGIREWNDDYITY